MKSAFITISTIFLFIIGGCNKTAIKGNNPEPGIALTFDDNYVDEWVTILPLLDSFDVKATFYISNYYKLSAAQKTKLKEIRDSGHEIAFHTSNHYNLNDYLSNGNMESLIKNEITNGLEKMNADGFFPKTFAYPYGKHNEALDMELLKHFKSVRALNGTPDPQKSISGLSKNKTLFGLGIDEPNKRSFEELSRLLNKTYTSNGCIILVGHHVEKPGTKLSVSKTLLRKLFNEAKSQNLRYYTISQISE